MRRLLNTLFVLTEDAYLALENENVVVKQGEKVLGRVPLLTLESIIDFSWRGASPALLGACASHAIGFSFLTASGKFLARVSGENPGNVLLRQQQYRVADDEAASLTIARDFITAKIYNARSVLERARRDHADSVDVSAIEECSAAMASNMRLAHRAEDDDQLRGLEGDAAHQYFQLFGQLILRQRKAFPFAGRMKRPPVGRVNAMLSFGYTLLAHDCAAALESVGLDAYVGFLHRPRSGRQSLALDLMEELRALFVDRFVVTLINNRVVKGTDFEEKEDGGTYLKKVGRQKFLSAWQTKKQVTITHPFLEEKIPWGLVPYVQSLLLARTLRGDLAEYPAFLWK